MSSYLDGEAAPSDAAAVEAHLRECATCRATLDAWRQATSAAADVPAPSAEHWDAVWHRISAEATRARSARRLRLDVYRAAFASAIAAGLLVAAFFLMPQRGTVTEPQTAAAGFEVIAVEVDSPDYMPVVMEGGEGQLPVVWLQRI